MTLQEYKEALKNAPFLWRMRFKITELYRVWRTSLNPQIVHCTVCDAYFQINHPHFMILNKVTMDMQTPEQEGATGKGYPPVAIKF